MQLDEQHVFPILGNKSPERRNTMTSLDFINSKFAVALAFAVSTVIPVSILVAKISSQDAKESFTHLIDSISVSIKKMPLEN